jgi:hypothetical protein
LTRIVLPQIVLTWIFLNTIAFAVSRGRHSRTLQLYSEAPTDFTPRLVDCARRSGQLRFLHSHV